MKKNTASRYGFIDAIRGIAACLVMLQHSLYQSEILGGPFGTKLIGFIPNRLELGETGVVAFFLVSGFVIPLSLEKTYGFRIFWIHRILRIYPLYITVYLVTFFLLSDRCSYSFFSFMRNFVCNALFIQEYTGQANFVGGSWTLSLEAVWYFAISFLFLVSMHKNTTFITVMTVSVSLVAELICAVGYHLPMGRLSMLVCCVLGLVCYRNSRNEISFTRFNMLSIILIASIALNLYVGQELFPSSHQTATFRMSSNSWMLAAVFFMVPFFTRKSIIWSFSVFTFLGRISYSIYLLHAMVLYILSKAHVHGFSLIGATFFCTILISIFTYRLIEFPPIRFGHSLKSKSSLLVKAVTVR